MNAYSQCENSNDAVGQMNATNRNSNEESLVDAQLLFDILEIIDKAAQAKAEAKCSVVQPQKTAGDYIEQPDNADFSNIIFTKYNINGYSKSQSSVQSFTNLKNFI